MIELIPEWSKVARQSWSSRLAIVSAVLSAAEVVTQTLAPSFGGRFATVAALVGIAAAVARVIAQPSLWVDKTDEPQ